MMMIPGTSSPDEAADDHKAHLDGIQKEGITELQHASETSLNDVPYVAAEVRKETEETLEGHADGVYTGMRDDMRD